MALPDHQPTIRRPLPIHSDSPLGPGQRFKDDRDKARAAIRKGKREVMCQSAYVALMVGRGKRLKRLAKEAKDEKNQASAGGG